MNQGRAIISLHHPLVSVISLGAGKGRVIMVTSKATNKIMIMGFIFFWGWLALSNLLEVSYLSANEKDYYHLVILGIHTFQGKMSLRRKMSLRPSTPGKTLTWWWHWGTSLLN